VHHARQAVEDLAAFGVRVIGLGGHDHPRVGLELTVRGERHPVRVEPGVGAEVRVSCWLAEIVGHVVGAVRPSYG
jgi:metallophosphoesterase superfamily enzyme